MAVVGDVEGVVKVVGAVTVACWPSGDHLGETDVAATGEGDRGCVVGARSSFVDFRWRRVGTVVGKVVDLDRVRVGACTSLVGQG